MHNERFRGPDYTPSMVDSLLEHVNEVIEEFRNAMRILPLVDDEGHSDCPFAEDLYAEKARWQEELQFLLGKLHEYQAGSQAEIRRCMRNQAVVEEDQRRLDGEHARDQYDQADDRVLSEYRQNRRARELLTAKIRVVASVLGEARERMFPGRRPRKPTPSFGAGLRPRGVDPELDDLFDVDARRGGVHPSPSDPYVGPAIP